jgi:hypothetical protein
MNVSIAGRLQQTVRRARTALAARSVDPDMSLLTRWLCGELSPEESAAVEERIQTDVDFYIMAAPVIDAWTLPVRLGPTLEQRAYERERNANESFWRYFTLTPWGGNMPKVAAVAVFAASISVYLIFGPHAQPPLPSRLRAPAPAPADTIRVAPTSTAQTYAVAETGPGQTRDIELTNGSHLTLRNDSRLTYRYVRHTFEARLVGELAGDIRDTTTLIAIRTSAGSVAIVRGTFAIRCEADCAAMLVTTGTGRAQVSGAPGYHGVRLTEWQFGRALKGGAGEQVVNAKGWPVLDPGVPQ